LSSLTGISNITAKNATDKGAVALHQCDSIISKKW